MGAVHSLRCLSLWFDSAGSFRCSVGLKREDQSWIIFRMTRQYLYVTSAVAPVWYGQKSCNYAHPIEPREIVVRESPSEEQGAARWFGKGGITKFRE